MAIYFGADHVVWAQQAGLLQDKVLTARAQASGSRARGREGAESSKAELDRCCTSVCVTVRARVCGNALLMPDGS